MLFKNTIAPETLFLIEELMEEPLLKNFRLVGGTTLSLLIGHRISDDIDLFTDADFNNDEIKTLFKTKYNKAVLNIQEFTFGLTIYYSNIESNHDIKIDIMRFSTDPFLDNYNLIEGLRFASLKDIAAMKLNAIKSRRTKKDFIDIYFLLNDFSLKEMIEFNKERFKYEEPKDALIGLSNIDDADEDMMPKMIKDVSWDEIKAKIKAEVQQYYNRHISG